jgi:hypothetical protein
MRRGIPVVAAAVLLGAAGMWRAFAIEPPADGSPDIHGSWSGRALATASHLGGAERNGASRRYLIILDILQDGPDITVEVTLVRDEVPLPTHLLTGKVGRGRFWAQGADAGGTGNALVALGTVDAKGTRLKGRELLLFDPPVQVSFEAVKH